MHEWLRMNGIGNPRIEAAFFEHLPQGAILIPAPLEEYLTFVYSQPIIQAQINAGIYTPSSLKEELLTVAWTWPKPRMVAVCMDLIRKHMETVPQMFGFGYAQSIAIHEAYHIRHHTKPCSLKEQIKRELECNEALEAHHPEIASLARRAEELSPTISRVMDRARRIGGRHHE